MRRLMALATLAYIVAAGFCLDHAPADQAAGKHGISLFNTDNLVAWCIVPFDAKQRGPEARAEMLAKLGLKKVAYDWRDAHVATFEEEILAYKKHGLEYFAFWSWHPAMESLIKKHGIHPQIWYTIPAPAGETQEERVVDAALKLQPMVDLTRRLGCRLGLYNHGGWSGEPVNMVAVCEEVRSKQKAHHVGIVYNQHHGHKHIKGFAETLKMMRPYLLCLNLNGMNTAAEPKILPIGQGEHDIELLEVISVSGYTGPIGVLDHRPELDTEEALRFNLDGLKSVKDKLRRGQK